jgi:IS66 C-terminal element
MYTLIETAKLNDIDPQAWLADVLARLPDYPAKRIKDLLPWNWRPPPRVAGPPTAQVGLGFALSLGNDESGQEKSVAHQKTAGKNFSTATNSAW